MKSWRINSNALKIQTPPCFRGLYQTIVAVLGLWEDVEQEGVQFLLTSRLNQDPLENEFSVARQRCGYERNPSASQFRRNLRHRIHLVLMKPPSSSNCEADEDEIPIIFTPNSTSTLTEERRALDPQSRKEDKFQEPTSHTQINDGSRPAINQSSLESCSVRFVLLNDYFPLL